MADEMVLYVNTASDGDGDGTTNATSGEHCAFKSARDAEGWIYDNIPDLTVENKYIRIRCSGGAIADDTYRFGYRAIKTSASCYVRLEPYDSSQAATPEGWKTDRYRMIRTNYLEVFNFGSNLKFKHLYVNGLQIGKTISSQIGSSYLLTVDASPGCVLEFNNCRIRANVETTGITNNQVVRVRSNDLGGIIKNCIIEQIGPYANEQPTIFNIGENSQQSKFYNCTIVGGSESFSITNATDSNKPIISNCLMIGAAGASDNAFHTNSTNNSSDGTAYGTNARSSQTFSFENAATGDYRLKDDDTGALNYGADLSGVGVLTDMVGTPRPQGDYYDIGAFELPQEGGSSIIPTLLTHFWSK